MQHVALEYICVDLNCYLYEYSCVFSIKFLLQVVILVHISLNGCIYLCHLLWNTFPSSGTLIYAPIFHTHLIFLCFFLQVFIIVHIFLNGCIFYAICSGIHFRAVEYLCAPIFHTHFIFLCFFLQVFIISFYSCAHFPQWLHISVSFALEYISEQWNRCMH